MGGDQPSETVYVRDLNERIKLEELRKALGTVFGPFGEIVQIRLRHAYKMRGQAFITYESAAAAKAAADTMGGFELFGKPLSVALARERADVLTKADGTYVPRERRKAEAAAAEAERARARARAELEAEAAAAAATAAAAPKPKTAEAAAAVVPIGVDSSMPHEKLFLQGLPADLTEMAIEMLFNQFPGLKEVRTVPGRVGIAFVEFGKPAQAAIALERLQGFKLTDEHNMRISFAKR
jgi:RNA recognition motif-containing protein